MFKVVNANGKAIERGFVHEHEAACWAMSHLKRLGVDEDVDPDLYRAYRRENLHLRHVHVDLNRYYYTLWTSAYNCTSGHVDATTQDQAREVIILHELQGDADMVYALNINPVEEVEDYV